MLDGRLVVGPYVRMACLRHQRDRARGYWTFDEARADHAITFFPKYLRLPDMLRPEGAPQPFVLLDFWQFIVGSLFGWIGPDGWRRFREAYIETGKGTGKTPVLAGVGLYGLTMDGELAAEIYAAASDREQAGYLFRAATLMVESSPALRPRVDVQVGNLKYARMLSFMRQFSRDQGAKSGARPHMGLIDELHEHPTPEIVNKIRAGAKGRRQPLFLEITNSGHDRASICWEHHEYSRRVLEGTVDDDRWFTYMCALDEGDDPLTDPACWPKANPGLGITITREYLENQVKKAKNIPSETNTVLRLNFCVWTQASVRWLDMTKWHRGTAIPSDEELRQAVATAAGLDLGRSDDFSSFVRVWELADGRVFARARFWLPRATIEKTRTRPYEAWARSGALQISEGDVTDFQQVEDDILAEHERQPIGLLGYDAKFATELAQRLQGEGVDVMPVKQGFALNEPIRRIETMVNDGTFRHDGDPVFAWMADNAVVTTGREGDLRLDKERSSEKIDGMVALAIAMFCLGRAQVSSFDGLVVA